MSFVKYEPMGDIAYLIVDRSSALNALNSQVLSDLDEALDNIDIDTVLREFSAQPEQGRCTHAPSDEQSMFERSTLKRREPAVSHRPDHLNFIARA